MSEWASSSCSRSGGTLCDVNTEVPCPHRPSGGTDSAPSHIPCRNLGRATILSAEALAEVDPDRWNVAHRKRASRGSCDAESPCLPGLNAATSVMSTRGLGRP